MIITWGEGAYTGIDIFASGLSAAPKLLTRVGTQSSMKYFGLMEVEHVRPLYHYQTGLGQATFATETIVGMNGVIGELQ